MAMDKAIKDFPKQFTYEPVVENADALEKKRRVIAAGMGGSHLAADIVKIGYSDMDMVVHEDYGLPSVPTFLVKETLFVANSYSGNTEETLDALNTAKSKGISCAAISTGGKLLDIAKEERIPHVRLPDTGIQPRAALGFHIRALMKLLGMEDALKETTSLAQMLDVEEAHRQGKALAETVRGRVPILYSSTKNRAIAYNWKIKCNETGKIPAFYNVFPELNHNEMTGFDIKEPTQKMGEAFHFIFLKDASDHPRIRRRMDVCKKLYEDRGLPVEEQELKGKNIWQKIFSSLLVADWTAFYISTGFGLEPEHVPMIEEFKKMI